MSSSVVGDQYHLLRFEGSREEIYEAVDRAKQLQLVRLAGEYLAKHRHRGEIRYDVLSLFWTGMRFVIRHFPDAFRPVSDPRRPWRWTM